MSRPEPFDWTYESPRVSIEPTDDPWKLDFADLEDEPLHRRNYAVRSYRISRDRFLIRGVVDDRKTGDSWIPGDDEPVVVHHMVLDLVVEFPSLVIAEANVVMETHPHEWCIRIEDKYQQLQGVSVARGFTHKVRELFGGPRGCTHTTALLQAMAPVAVQSMWSFRMMAAADAGGAGGPDFSTPEARMRAMATNLNTCHIWAEDGEQVTGIRNGEPMEVPVWIVKRFRELGLDHNSWRNQG